MSIVESIKKFIEPVKVANLACFFVPRLLASILGVEK